MLEILVWAAGVYLVGMFAVLRLAVPFMGFWMYRIPDQIPDDYRRLINEWEMESAGAEEFLKKSYDFSVTYWKPEKFQTVSQFARIFRRDLQGIWDARGYLHCNTMNYVLACLLANSKFFTQDDIRIRHTVLNWVQHQYLQIRVNGKWMDVDPAGSYVRGLPMGQRAGLF